MIAHQSQSYATYETWVLPVAKRLQLKGEPLRLAFNMSMITEKFDFDPVEIAKNLESFAVPSIWALMRFLFERYTKPKEKRGLDPSDRKAVTVVHELPRNIRMKKLEDGDPGSPRVRQCAYSSSVCSRERSPTRFEHSREQADEQRERRRPPANDHVRVSIPGVKSLHVRMGIH